MFTPSERAIYQYHNGKKVVSVDPVEVWKKFFSAPGFDVVVDDKIINMGPGPGFGFEGFDQKRYALFLAAQERWVAALRHAFAPDADELSSDDMSGLWFDFVAFSEDLAKKKGALPTCVQSTGVYPPDSTTPPSTVSGSTGTGPTTSKPPRSSSPCKSPSAKPRKRTSRH